MTYSLTYSTYETASHLPGLYISSKSSNSRWTSLEFRVGLTLPNFMQLYDWQLKSQFVDGISRYIHQGIRFQYSGNTVQVFEDSLRVLLNLNGTRTEGSINKLIVPSLTSILYGDQRRIQGAFGHAPFSQTIFFTLKKMENFVDPLLCMSTSGQRKFAPPLFEILNTPLMATSA